MSAPLKELRFGVPESVHILLNARATAFDEDIGALARKILTDWAKREAHAAQQLEDVMPEAPRIPRRHLTPAGWTWIGILVGWGLVIWMGSMLMK